MNDLFTLFTGPLERAGVRYMVTGGVAAIVYGEPRLTHDIDLVVELDTAAIDAIVAAFADEDFYCAPKEIIELEARRPQRGHFNLIHHETGFKADVYVAAGDEFQQWALSNYSSLQFSGQTLRVAPPEYVIVRKLEYFREGGSAKHLSDIRGILRHHGAEVDDGLLERRIDERGLGQQWARVRSG